MLPLYVIPGESKGDGGSPWGGRQGKGVEGWTLEQKKIGKSGIVKIWIKITLDQKQEIRHRSATKQGVWWKSHFMFFFTWRPCLLIGCSWWRRSKPSSVFFLFSIKTTCFSSVFCFVFHSVFHQSDLACFPSFPFIISLSRKRRLLLINLRKSVTDEKLLFLYFSLFSLGLSYHSVYFASMVILHCVIVSR